MRTMTYLFIVLLISGLTLNAYSEPFRKTAADMYAESYMAKMRRQTGLSTAEVRAENYRRLYEKCDEHYNCTNETAGEENSTKQNRKMDSQVETVKPFIQMPLWQ